MLAQVPLQPELPQNTSSCSTTHTTLSSKYPYIILYKIFLKVRQSKIFLELVRVGSKRCCYFSDVGSLNLCDARLVHVPRTLRKIYKNITVLFK